MREKIVEFIKKQWLLAWIIIASALLIGICASAVYISTTNTMKRVVVSSSGQNQMFSSNILVENGTGIYVPRYFSGNTQSGGYSVDVFLWNYSLTNPAQWYSQDIDYTLTLRLTDSGGTALAAEDVGTRSVLIKDSAGNTIGTLNSSQLAYEGENAFSGKLTYHGNESDQNKYTLTFSDGWDLENDTNICVKVVATPDKGIDNSKYQDLSALGAIIGLKKTVSIESTGWQTYLLEEQDNITVTNCDGYNMVVTGSGKAKITIKWNTDYLECNKYFRDGTVYEFGTYTGSGTSTKEVYYTAPPEGSKIATLVITADTGSDVTQNRNRYDIQFYKTGIGEPTAWNFVTNIESDLEQNPHTKWIYTNVEQ